MNIKRMFANAIVRRIAYVLVAAVVAAVMSIFGTGSAYAQSHPIPVTCSSAAAQCTREQAYAECGPWAANDLAVAHPQDWITSLDCEHTPDANGYSGRYRSTNKSPVAQDNHTQLFVYTSTCPPGKEWNESLKKCFDPEECLQRNGAENGMPLSPVAKPFQQKCVAGCTLAMQTGPDSSCTVVHLPGGPQTHCNGVFQYTGGTCEASPPGDDDTGPEPDQDSCTPTGPNSGTKFCKKKDGRECFESNSGAMICWGTGETGQKSNGADAQTRGPGTDEPQPDPPTPPESFDPDKKGDPTTTTTTTNNNNGSTTTTTTTTINNSTTNGTNPPGTPVGGGSGGGGSGEDGDEDGNSASGGGSCTEPPVVEGDPALGMIALQTWETRCALEKIGEVTVTGDIGDCNSPFSVEGPEKDVNVQTMKAMRAEICPGGQTASEGDGDAIDWSGLDGPDSAEGSGLFVTEEIGADGLDTTGLGFMRTCPTIPPIDVMGTTIQFDNSVMCDWLELGGQIMLILAALVSVRIMAGVGT